MSTDHSVTKDLVQTLEDGKEGFRLGAENLEGDGRSDLATSFAEFRDQRARFSDELTQMASAYADDVDQTGSVAGTLHRGWLSLKDALTGSDPSGVLKAAEQGEDHAVREYEKALEHDDLSPELRAVVERQYAEVKAAHDTIRSLRDTQSV